MNGFFWPGPATGLPSASKPVLAAVSCPGNGGAPAVAEAGAAAAGEAGGAAAGEAGGGGDGGEVCAVEAVGGFGTAALGGGSSVLRRPQPARARITIDPKARPTNTLRRERAKVLPRCPQQRHHSRSSGRIVSATSCRKSLGAKVLAQTSCPKSLAAAFTAVSPAA